MSAQNESHPVPSVIQPSRSYRRLKMSPLETVFLVAMVVALTIACFDAQDGQRIGKNNALTVAKLQGQQELMAWLSKVYPSKQ